MKTGLTVHINMENDETVVETTTDDTEVEIKDGEAEEVEETSDGDSVEVAETTTEDKGEKLTYEQKLARATTPEEKFAIADAEANKNRRLLIKANRPKTTTAAKPKATSQATKEPSIEETVLKAQGVPKELLTVLKKVAALNGTSLIDAQTDEIYLAKKSEFEKENKRKAASLGGGRGAGARKPEKNFMTPGLSRDEHKEMHQAAIRGK